MKKTFVTLLALLTIGITVTIADPVTKVDPNILSAFQKEFSFAKNVSWQEDGSLTRVNFVMNDQGITAWYNSKAELVTTARNILYNQLPISVMRSLRGRRRDGQSRRLAQTPVELRDAGGADCARRVALEL